MVGISYYIRCIYQSDSRRGSENNAPKTDKVTKLIFINHNQQIIGYRIISLSCNQQFMLLLLRCTPHNNEYGAFCCMNTQTTMTIWKNVKKYKIEGSILNLNKDRSGRRKTERTQENINLPREELLEYPRISASKNSLDISKSTLITKRDLKWHPHKMQARKERIVNEVDLLKEIRELLKRVTAGKRRRMRVCL